MCGRFALYQPVADLVERFGVDEVVGEDPPPRWNVAPTQPVLAVASSRDGRTRRLGSFRWGLVPWWARDPSIGNRFINARSESLAGSRAFGRAFERRRCLIPASGFYEWRAADPSTKGPGRPFFIEAADGRPLALAGLWEVWYDAENRPLRTCTIVTTRPNAALAELHDRMPVIVPDAHWDGWLAPQPIEEEEWRTIVQPPPDAALDLFEVDRQVNDPRHEGPELLRPPPATSATP